MKFFNHKTYMLLSCVLSILLATTTSPVLVNKTDTHKVKNDVIKKEIKLEDKKENQKELQEEKNEEQVDDNLSNSEELNNVQAETTTNINASSVPRNEVVKEESSNVPITNNQQVTTTETQKSVPVQEVVEEKKYIGVADPNNYNYSFHHGKIEYSDLNSCTSSSEEIAFKDTVDIINSWCLDVRDSNNTILGYYLYINCSSGNCDKYKN